MNSLGRKPNGTHFRCNIWETVDGRPGTSRFPLAKSNEAQNTRLAGTVRFLAKTDTVRLVV